MKDRWHLLRFGLRRRTPFAFRWLAAGWFGTRCLMLGILAKAFAGYTFERAVTARQYECAPGLERRAYVDIFPGGELPHLLADILKAVPGLFQKI